MIILTGAHFCLRNVWIAIFGNILNINTKELNCSMVLWSELLVSQKYSTMQCCVMQNLCSQLHNIWVPLREGMRRENFLAWFGGNISINTTLTSGSGPKSLVKNSLYRSSFNISFPTLFHTNNQSTEKHKEAAGYFQTHQWEKSLTNI